MDWNAIQSFYHDLTTGQIIIITLQLIFLLLLPFLKRYLDEKAKLLATKENFETYKEQLKVIEKQTNSIKNQLANKYLIEHKQWSLKRDIYLELLETLQSLSDLLANLIICFKKDEPNVFKDDFFQKKYIKEVKPLGEQLNKLNAVKVKGRIILSDETIRELDEMTKSWLEASGEPFNPTNASRDIFMKILLSSGRAQNKIIELAKDELIQ